MELLNTVHSILCSSLPVHVFTTVESFPHTNWSSFTFNASRKTYEYLKIK